MIHLCMSRLSSRSRTCEVKRLSMLEDTELKDHAVDINGHPRAVPRDGEKIEGRTNADPNDDRAGERAAPDWEKEGAVKRSRSTRLRTSRTSRNHHWRRSGGRGRRSECSWSNTFRLWRSFAKDMEEFEISYAYFEQSTIALLESWTGQEYSTDRECTLRRGERRGQE